LNQSAAKGIILKTREQSNVVSSVAVVRLSGGRWKERRVGGVNMLEVGDRVVNKQQGNGVVIGINFRDNKDYMPYKVQFVKLQFWCGTDRKAGKWKITKVSDETESDFAKVEERLKTGL
jgi:hypothetical protein